VTSFPAGANLQGRAIQDEVVRTVYNALLLNPAALRDALKGSFTKGASHALLRAKVGVPPGATELRTKTRSSHIGIQVHGWSTGFATVRVVYSAQLEGKTIKAAETSTLWLQRDKSHWRVIGFDILRKRVS
jgi:hypothetical protein